MLDRAILFCDGACKGNPGPGGWGVVAWLPDDELVRELAGREERTTNNVMELRAALEALRLARASCPPTRSIVVLTDSAYVVQGATGWIHGWRRNAWKKADGQPVANRELWEAIAQEVGALGARLAWRHLPGHAGVPGNERVDALASGAAAGDFERAYRGPLTGYEVPLFDGLDEVFAREAKIAPSGRKSAGAAKSNKPAPDGSKVFYLSYLDGKLERHATWPACEARVKGRAGAKFKKISSAAEEAATLKGWGL